MSKSRSPRESSKGMPNPLDVWFGQQIRAARTGLGMSQTHLAECLGITFQQVQKYEKGTNRVSFSRLVDLCRVLSLRLDKLMDSVPTSIKHASPGLLANSPKRELPTVEKDSANTTANMQVIRMLSAMSPQVRRAAIFAVRALYKEEL